MNAKKISTLLLCSAGIAMLAACSGKSLTRADAETKLDVMATAITNKSGYTAPTKVTVTGTAANYEYSNDDSFAHKKYVTDSKNKSGSVIASANTEIWAYVDGSQGYYVVNDGTNKLYQKVDKAVVVATVEGKVSTAVTSMEGSPAYISSYLKKFDSLSSTSNYSGVNAGATTNGSIMGIKDENYTSSADGYLDAKWTSVYPKETPADEPLEYKYEKNMLVKSYNGKSNTTVNYTWGSAAVSKATLTGYTEVTLTDVVNLAVLVAYIAVL
jgi:hypothetical protein